MIRRRIGYLVAGFMAMAFATAHGQAVATVCKDGSTSATTGRGACSGHGGVDAKATKTAKAAEKKAEKATKAAEKQAEKTTKAAEKAADQVACSDGTMSKGGRGACSGHGGIKSAAAAAAAAPAPAATAKPAPTLPAPVPAASPARTKSEAKSQAPAKASSKRSEDNDPTDAIAQCKDGMYSHAANHQGACSRHGGVAKFLKP